jgi:hypothetical protein
MSIWMPSRVDVVFPQEVKVAPSPSYVEFERSFDGGRNLPIERLSGEEKCYEAMADLEERCLQTNVAVLGWLMQI